MSIVSIPYIWGHKFYTLPLCGGIGVHSVLYFHVLRPWLSTVTHDMKEE